jgi:hypothetical protein
MSDELTLMKAAAAAAATPPPAAAPDDMLAQLRKQREAFTVAAPTPPAVEDSSPVQAVATAAITYRDPQTGEAKSTSVRMRVLLRTDERMLVWQVAYATLRMQWDIAPAIAREEAYAQAVCRVQWDEDKTVPDWFKRAYIDDPELAVNLAGEVDALTEAYFRGGDGAGSMAPPKRFVVERESSATTARSSVSK